MCDSNAYVRRGAAEELLLREVVVVEPADGGYRLQSLFGEEAVVKGTISLIDLLKHKIVFLEA